MREDLVQSAIQFLTDPQVAESPLAKRVEFLQSKKMTQEEIDEALRRAEVARANGTSVGPPSSSSALSGPAAPNTMAATGVAPYRAPIPQYMLQPPPVPKRDWKDYFVMATVSVGVAYGIYEVARRYVLPMIVPPTPASLEADRAALEAEFARTEALVEQLHKDTEEMKESERKRAEAFEKVMQDARKAVEDVTSQADNRKQDLKLLRTNVETLQDLLPKALDKHRENQAAALEDLKNELKSLKSLVGNRTRTSGPPPASSVLTSVPGVGAKPFIPNPANSSNAASSSFSTGGSSSGVGAPTSGAGFSTPSTSSSSTNPGSTAATGSTSKQGSSTSAVPVKPVVESSGEPKEPSNSGIPAWQLAAKESAST